jgi:hypothetical protein
LLSAAPGSRSPGAAISTIMYDETSDTIEGTGRCAVHVRTLRKRRLLLKQIIEHRRRNFESVTEMVAERKAISFALTVVGQRANESHRQLVANVSVTP